MFGTRKKIIQQNARIIQLLESMNERLTLLASVVRDKPAHREGSGKCLSTANWNAD
jgi:hypothetical protein